MTADTPKFGSLPDWEKSSHYMENFGIEMFRCTKSYGGRSKNVNILHVSTDLDGARHEMERIVQFMKKKGFDVKHESIPGMRNDMGVDIVIVGSETASHNDVRYLIQHISLGFLGVDTVVGCVMVWYRLHPAARSAATHNAVMLQPRILYGWDLFGTCSQQETLRYCSIAWSTPHNADGDRGPYQRDVGNLGGAFRREDQGIQE